MRIVTSLIAIGCALSIAGCGMGDDGGEAFREELAKQQETSFRDTCVTNSEKYGIAEGAAEKVCDCATDSYINDHEFEERLSLTSEQSLDIVKKCNAEVG